MKDTIERILKEQDQAIEQDQRIDWDLRDLLNNVKDLIEDGTIED